MTDPSSLTLPEDIQEARKVFQSLPFQNQLELLLHHRGKERLHTLFLSEHPEELIPALPEQEIYLTIKEVGERDCLEIISLTTPEQFQYLLDLELWKRDQLDTGKVLHWMELLLESGEKKLAQFIRTADLEWIALLLINFIHVTTLEGEQTERMDHLPLFTLDQFYFIDFKGVKTREVFEPFLKTFSRIDGEGYRRLMESLICELASELEEIGYRMRNGRLNDYGFPDLEEALEIYRFIQPESPLRREGAFKPRGFEPIGRESSIYYMTFRAEGPFFSTILSRIDNPKEQDQLKQEITSLCNKAIVAEAIDLSNLAGMERVIQKVYHYLNLGLQYLSSEEERRAIEILRSFPIQKVFQCGVSLTILLKRRAETILKGSWVEGDRENLVLLDPLHLETLEGVLRKRPAFYRNGAYDDFRDLRDIKAMESFLESIEALLSFFGEKLKVSSRSLKEIDLSGCHPDKWQEITLSTLFLTALANQILQGRFHFEAIERARLNDLLSYLFERDTHGKGAIRMDIRNRLREGLSSMENDPQRREHLLAFQDFCLDLFEESFGKIPPGEETDPRFVKGLLIHT
jgi:hypothetical protein